MTEQGASNSVRGAFAWYLYRRLGTWQWRALVAAVAASLLGLAGVVYFTLAGEGASTGKPVPPAAKLAFQAMIGGMAFIVAFALFFWLRSILKWAAGIVAVVVVAGLVISHLSGANVDTSKVREGYESVAGWSWSGGKSLLDALTLNWTGTISAGIGSFLGLRRGRG